MKVFKITQTCTPQDTSEWLTSRDIEDCLRGDAFIGKDVELKIEVVLESDDPVTEQEVVDHLMSKVKNETDSDRCHSWACALDRLCDAIRTRNGG